MIAGFVFYNSKSMHVNCSNI